MHRTFSMLIDLDNLEAQPEHLPQILRNFAQRLEENIIKGYSCICNYNVYDNNGDDIGNAELHLLPGDKYVTQRVVQRR